MKRTPHSMRFSAAELAVAKRGAAVLDMPMSTFARIATVTLAQEIIAAVDTTSESLREHVDEGSLFGDDRVNVAAELREKMSKVTSEVVTALTEASPGFAAKVGTTSEDAEPR